MASFNYTVDTGPMAQTINSVSHHVNATTTAVVALQTAVIFAEEKAANQVCDNLNKGFFTLLHSQISQKLAKALSEVDSLLMQLNQQRKQLLTIRGRMERDYNMIASRYLKLFNGLNMNLKQRVVELDKPVMNFALREVGNISNRTKYLTATVPVTQSESLTISQKIVASNVKNRGHQVIDSMSRFLSDVYKQKKLTDRIKLSADTKFENSTLYLPVIINESNFDRFDNKNLEIVIQSIELSKPIQGVIKNAVMTQMEHLQWRKETAIDREIISEFSKILSTAPVSTRVKEMANRLFLANHYQTINKPIV